MVKILKMENLDCAHCASQMEKKIKKIQGVNSVSISFMAQKMVLDAEDDKFDEVLKAAVKAARRVEPDFEIEL